MGFNSGFKGLSQGTAQVSNLSGTRHDFLGTRHFDVCVSWADSMALAFLAKGELWRHRIRNWYVYRVSRDIDRSCSMNNDPAISITRGDTCTDAVFTRHVEYSQTMNFVSYFSYHKPLLSIAAQTHSVNLWWHSCTVIFVGNNNKIH